MTAACAAIVARDDPLLYATALFAPEPARARLMVLYAFDIELSRATRASAESLIPRMRLQWWRDAIEAAEAGAAPKAHEVAAPLAGLIADRLVDPVDLESMAQAREWELDRPFDRDTYARWHTARFNPLVRAAADILCAPTRPEGERPVPPVSHACGLVFAVRHAPAMAARGEGTCLPDVRGTDLAALARGEMTGAVRASIAALMTEAEEERDRVRSQLPLQDRRATPALLPMLHVDRVLNRLASHPEAICGGLDDLARPFDGLRLAWRAWRGRW